MTKLVLTSDSLYETSSVQVILKLSTSHLASHTAGRDSKIETITDVNFGSSALHVILLTTKHLTTMGVMYTSYNMSKANCRIGHTYYKTTRWIVA